MKKSAVARIIIFSLIAVCLLAALLAGIGFKLYDRRVLVVKKGSDAPVVEQTVFSPEDIRSLKISWVSGDITIEPGDTQDITVTEEISGGGRPMVLKKSGSQLIVEYSEEDKPITLSVGSSISKNLTITVPQDWECGNLVIDAASANVQVTNLTALDVDVDTASGEHTFQNCDFRTLDMDSVSGGLDFTGTLNELSFDGTSARANIRVFNKPESIEIDTISGDLELTLPSDCGFTIDRDTLSGGTNIEFDVGTTAERQDGRLVYGDGACSIEINGLSASIHIYKGESF